MTNEEKLAQITAIANELSWNAKTRPIADRLLAVLRDSGSGSQSEDAPAAEAAGPQSGGEAASPER